MPSVLSRRPSSTCIMCRASTISSTKTSSSIVTAMAAGTVGEGYYSFDANGVHFIGLVNVVNLKAGGLGNLGAEQLAWLEQDLRGRSKSTPIVVFAHIPLWTVYPQWGWGTEDSAQALDQMKGFGSVTVLNGHIHQVMQKGRRQRHLPHRALDRIPAAGARYGALARPDESRRQQAAAACSASPASTSSVATSVSPLSIRHCRVEG